MSAASPKADDHQCDQHFDQGEAAVRIGASRALVRRMIGAHERRLAERVAVDRGARLRGLARERQPEGRSVAARGDYHLRGRGRLVVEHTLLDGLEHYLDRIELQFERDSLRQVAMAELLFVV